MHQAARSHSQRRHRACPRALLRTARHDEQHVRAWRHVEQQTREQEQGEVVDVRHDFSQIRPHGLGHRLAGQTLPLRQHILQRRAPAGPSRKSPSKSPAARQVIIE